MEEYYPSEIARLVLGYLKEVECSNSWKTFVQESTGLREYYRLYKQGRIYSTNVNGKSLVESLGEYCALKSKVISEVNQSKGSNNNYNYEVFETPSKASQNAYTRVTINQQVQTSASIFPCQTPKRKSNCRVTQLNFDHEAKSVNKKNTLNDSDTEEELMYSNSVPNCGFDNNITVASDIDYSGNPITTKPKFHDISVQTDLNCKENQNVCNVGIQTENLCHCSSDLIKSSQTNRQLINSLQSNTEVDYEICNSSNDLGSAEMSTLLQNSETTRKVCDNVSEESFSVLNNNTLSESATNGKNYIASETLLSQDLPGSPLLTESVTDKKCCSKETSSERISSTPRKSPIVNCIQQTEETKLDTVEDMEVTHDTLKDNLPLVEDLTYEKHSTNNPELNNASDSSIVNNSEKSIELDENSCDIENKKNLQTIPNTNKPDDQLNGIDKVIELSGETSYSVQVNEISYPMNLDAEIYLNSHEKSSDNQETIRPTNSGPQLNISAASTEYPHKNNAFDNVPVFTDKTSKLLTGSSNVARECSQDINSAKYLPSKHKECQYDLDSSSSKIQSGVILSADVINTNSYVKTNTEISKMDSMNNKAQLSNVSNPESNQSALNKYTQNNIDQVHNATSVNDQTSSTIATSLLSNKPISGLALPNPTIPTLQSVPSVSYIQNNGQYEYFMFVPTVKAVNTVISPPVTAIANVNNLNVTNRNVSALSTSTGKNSTLVANSPIKQTVIASSPIRPPTETGKSNMSPCKLNIATSEVDIPSKKIWKASKKRKTKRKDLNKQKKHKKDHVKSCKRASKQNRAKRPLSSSVSSPEVITEKTFNKNMDSSKLLSTSEKSITCKASSIITDQVEREKEYRVLRVLVSDVLKSSHIQCLDFNNSTDHVDKSKDDLKKNNLEKLCMQNMRSQPVVCLKENDKCSYQSITMSDGNYVHETEKNHLVTSSFRNKVNVDSCKKKISEVKSSTNIVTNEINNSEETMEFPIAVEKHSSGLHDIEDLNSENSTGILVTSSMNALENCDDMPENIEVVLLSDKEDDVNVSQSVTIAKKSIPYYEDVEQQNLDNKFSVVKETEISKNHINCKKEQNVTLEEIANCEHVLSAAENVDSIKHKSSEKVLDLDQLEQSDVALQHDKIERNSSSNIDKEDNEQNSVNIESARKQIINVNNDIPATVYNDFSSEREDLDSSRSLMINTSPLNEEENGENIENSSISSDRDNLENEDSSNPVNRSNCCSNFDIEENFNDICVPNVLLYTEKERNASSSITQKFSSEDSSCCRQDRILNSNVKASVHDEEDNSSDLKKKINAHLPQSLVDSVKYFDSQTKLRKMVKHQNLNSCINNSTLSKETSECQDTSLLDLTSSSMQTANAHKYLSVPSEEILSLAQHGNSSGVNIKNSRTLNQCSNSFTVTEKSQNSEQNGIMLCADKEETCASFDINKKSRLFTSTGSFNVEKLGAVTCSNSSHLHINKPNDDTYGVMIPFKKRMRHCSYDSSFNCKQSSQNIIKSKSSTSLEIVGKEELCIETDTHRKYDSTDAINKLNETVTFMSCPADKCSSSNFKSKMSLKLNTDPINSASGDNKHAKVLSVEDSQSPIKFQQGNSRKFTAKRLLLQELSDSEEDLYSPSNVQTNTDKFSAKKKMRKEDLHPPVEVQPIFFPNIQNTCNSFEQGENQSRNEISDRKNIPERDEYICTNLEEINTINNGSEQAYNVESDVCPQIREHHSPRNNSDETSANENRDLLCSFISCKRKSATSCLNNEYLADVNNSGEKIITPEKNCDLNSEEFYTNNHLMKKKKLNKISSSSDAVIISSPEKDNFSCTVVQDSSQLSSNECSVNNTKSDSLASLSANPVHSTLVKSTENYVTAQDSPVRYVSNAKKVKYKSALRKRIEKDPNIPAGVKIPSKWNSSKIINYSHEIGHSICDETINPKKINVSQKKLRLSRPTLKISSLQSPSKEQSCTKKNLSQKSCSESCLSGGPTSRNTVCGWLSKKNKQKNLSSRKPVRKSIKMSNKKSVKLINKGNLSINENAMPPISNESLNASSQVSDEKTLVKDMLLTSKDFDHCETTQDIVEADIGRSDENGSELANAIAGVERELLDLPPNSMPDSPQGTMEYKSSTEEKASVIPSNCEEEGTEEQFFPKLVVQKSKLSILMDKIKKLGVDKILEKLAVLEDRKQLLPSDNY